MILALLACNGETTEPPPDFNYIPIYSDVCLPDSLDDQNAARDVVDAHIDASEFLVGTNMDLCHENSCVPCDTTSNPMLGTVRDFDDWSTVEAQAVLAGVDGDVDLEAYFATALDYEWRYLLFSTPTAADGSTTLTLSQGIRQDCGADCWQFQVAHESLDDECLVFNNTMAATKTPSDDGYSLTTAAGQNDFGFQVPLTEELPTPASFASVDALEAFVLGIPSMPVTMADPTVEFTWDDATGQGCATVTGFTPASTFAEYAEGSLDAYADASHADHIKTVLAIELASPTVDTWSSR